MPRVSVWLVLIGVLLMSMMVISPNYSRAELNPVLQAGFGQALVAVNNAEEAGATPTETAPLVTLLNRALELNQQASSLPSNQTEQRNAVSSNVNQILTNVTTQASDLAATSAQRTYTSKIVTYVAGALVAVFGTFAYVFGVELYQRYRIKRVFQMRVKAR